LLKLREPISPSPISIVFWESIKFDKVKGKMKGRKGEGDGEGEGEGDLSLRYECCWKGDWGV